MKSKFTQLVDKHKKVYILKFKKMNKYILDTGIDHAFCSVGIHSSGQIQIVTNKKSRIVVPESSIFDIVNGINKSLCDCINDGLIIPYSKEQNDNRISKKIERQKFRTIKRNEKRDRIDNFKKELSLGIKRPLPLDQWIERTEIELSQKSTRFEDVVYRNLNGKDKSMARRQEPFKINGKVYFVDIYIPCKKIAIEVDGGYHNTPDQIEKDKKRDADLLSKGVRTIRIPNEAVHNGTLNSYMKQIRKCKKSKNARC